MKLIDIIGNRYGKLTVVSRSSDKVGRDILWLCQCDCGNKSKNTKGNLKSGRVISCGCLKKEGNNKSHMMSKTRQYYIWAFEGFWEDMRDGYKDNLTIDRINSDENYCKENCKWSTYLEQGNNKRNNHVVEFNGERHNLSEWSRLLNINVHTITDRLRRDWTVEKTLTRPVGKWI